MPRPIRRRENSNDFWRENFKLHEHLTKQQQSDSKPKHRDIGVEY